MISMMIMMIVIMIRVCAVNFDSMCIRIYSHRVSQMGVYWWVMKLNYLDITLKTYDLWGGKGLCRQSDLTQVEQTLIIMTWNAI
jgi:hypothetical protein